MFEERRRTKTRHECDHKGQKEVKLRIFIICQKCHIIEENLEYTKFVEQMRHGLK